MTLGSQKKAPTNSTFFFPVVGNPKSLSLQRHLINRKKRPIWGNQDSRFNRREVIRLASCHISTGPKYSVLVINMSKMT